MITKILTCDYCGNSFSRTDYPSRFMQYKTAYCCKSHAMIGAARLYRPKTTYVQRHRDGRWFVRLPDHPRANKNNQVPRAHLVVECYLTRFLEDGEVVHHCDGNPSNDRLENLELMLDVDHRQLHTTKRERDKDGKFTRER